MRGVTKLLGAAAAVTVAATLGWYALAQTPGPGGPMGFGTGPGMMMGTRGGFGPMHGGFADPAPRLATLKDRLGVTDAQAPAWDAYAEVVQDTVQSLRTQQEATFQALARNPSFEDRQALMAKAFEQHQQAARDVHDAALKLLPALDERQKGRAEEILPGLAPFGPGLMHAGFGPMGMGPHGGAFH